MDKIIQFQLEKETKGTFRYKEIVPENEKMVTGILYIRKEFLGEEKPEKLEVQIKSV